MTMRRPTLLRWSERGIEAEHVRAWRDWSVSRRGAPRRARSRSALHPFSTRHRPAVLPWLFGLV